jgi:hypothetical protein
MRKIYSSHDRLLAGFIQGVLEDNGIACLMRNEFLNGGVGELPPIECWPELWVVADGDSYRAHRIIEEVLEGDAAECGLWRCVSCGEIIDPQFHACWRCTGASNIEWEA